MKKILILVPLNKEDFYTELKELELWRKESCDAYFFSPTFIMSKKEKSKKDFFVELLASVVAIEKHGLGVDLDGLEEKVFIYFGPAPTNIKFDNIYSVRESVLSTQESYYDNLMKKQNTLFNKKIIPQKAREIDFYRSHHAQKDFKTVGEVLKHIKKGEE